MANRLQDFIEHESVLELDMAWTEDIIQCLSPQLLQKYHTFITQC